MSRLVLRDRRDGRAYAFDRGPVLIGRADACDLIVSGAGSDVVSGQHARALLEGDAWVIEDSGGRNGTFVDGARVPTGGRLSLASGSTLTLGAGEIAFTVEIDAAAQLVELELVHLESDEVWQGAGHRLRLGRSEECEVCLFDERRVSRIHCEIFAGHADVAFVRDLDSSHGTLLDGSPLHGDGALWEGARLKLGERGPELLVRRVAVRDADARDAPTPTLVPTRLLRVPDAAPPAAEPVAPVESPVPSGRTAFFKALIRETEHKHASRTRKVVWAFLVLLVATVGGALGLSELRLRETQTELAAQRAALDEASARADSTRAADLAEYRRLESELAAARAQAAPSTIVDSLRREVDEAASRTAFLAEALERSQEEMERQLSAGDSLRLAQAAETERLRALLVSSQAGGVSAAELEALRAEVRAAEERAAQLEAGMRAMRGTDLASIAEAHQEATGLVSVFAGENIYDGSGFVLTRSGYFVTNRHVANPEGQIPDSVHITMADQRTGHRARVVAVHPAGGPDLAVLQIPSYVGPFIAEVDWEGTRARQGEPAALIGFPAGVSTALDDTRTVRTSMSAGIFSKVTDTQIQFDGFTIGGSSGSPIFNADGEVVAVHSSGLRDAAGLGFAVPVRLVLPLLPPDALREVGR